MPITLAHCDIPTTPDEAIIAYLRTNQHTPGVCAFLPMTLTILLEHDQFTKTDLRETLADMIAVGEVVHAPYETEEGQSTYLLYVGAPAVTPAAPAPEKKQVRPPMTNDEYIDDGAQRCPHCRSGYITTCSAVHHDGHTAWVDTTCYECHAEWQDVYELVGYTTIKQPRQ